MSRVHCKRNGCGAALEPITDTLGRVALVCRPCRRNTAGRCRDCSTGSVTSTRPGFFPMRCDRCRAAHFKRTRNTSNLRSYYRNRRARLAQMKNRYHTDAEARAAILERGRVYRKAHPRTADVDRQLSRKYTQRHRAKQKAAQEQNRERYQRQRSAA